MNKNYITKKKTIIDALDDIDMFIDSIEKITVEKPELVYTYDIKIKPIDDGELKWEVHLNLQRDGELN